MIKSFENYGITISEEQRILFEKYYDLLIEYNNRFNIKTLFNLI